MSTLKWPARGGILFLIEFADTHIELRNVNAEIRHIEYIASGTRQHQEDELCVHCMKPDSFNSERITTTKL